MKLVLAIGAGGFVGSICRYLLSLLIQTKYPSHFPWGTLVVNIIGCFLIGVIYSLFEKGNVSHEWRLIIATGVIGGFTTFSAFSYETIAMFKCGQFWSGGTYVVASILFGLIAAIAGILVIKFL